MKKHLIIGISGYSGSGKDEVSGQIVDKFGAVKIGFADEAKRHMASTYDFSHNQLFGPSQFRNAGDHRYPKPIFNKLKCVNITQRYVFDINNIDLLPNNEKYEVFYKIKDYERNEELVIVPDNDPYFFLSPREALQIYCELMNTMYELTWVRKGIENHFSLVLHDNLKYNVMEGLNEKIGRRPSDNNGLYITCTSDIRHWNEIHFLRNIEKEDVDVCLIRVKRPSVPRPPYNHRSELEQETIPDSIFDYVINNDSDLKSLHEKVYLLISSHILNRTSDVDV